MCEAAAYAMRQFNASNGSAIEFFRKTYRYPFQTPVEPYYMVLDVFTFLVTISQNIFLYVSELAYNFYFIAV